PTPYKIYKKLTTVDLHLDKSCSMPALQAIVTNPKADGNKVLDICILAKILYYSAGITKIINYPGIGDVEFRAAACTGALYHTEIYVICGNIDGLEAGVYHFDPKGMKLGQLRPGDYRRVLIDATANHPSVEHAPVILVYTDIFTRNSVKYQAREYRHAFWDCGTILANTLTVCSAHDLSGKVIVGFVDDTINSLLGLNTEKEVSLVLVPIGFTKEITANEEPQITKLDLKTEPLSNYDFDDPEIQNMHQASSLTSSKEVRGWMGSTPKTSMHAGNIISLKPFSENELPQDPLEKVVVRRGSAREFSRDSISFQQLSTIIDYSTRGVQADFLEPYGTTLIHPYLIVNAVDGLKPGSYVYNREQNALQLLGEGMFRQVAGNLGLGQNLPADSSVAIFFMTDLDTVLKRFGNRGYRAAQLEASIIGGRFYLTAYTQKLGASGLTFYDDAVTQFFSPHAKDKSVMFMVTLGKKK
ncbi:MAG: SagB/ThcOx family dehydrogenase, partial [Nitrosopumilaceae archaeon]